MGVVLNMHAPLYTSFRTVDHLLAYYNTIKQKKLRYSLQVIYFGHFFHAVISKQFDFLICSSDILPIPFCIRITLLNRKIG